MDAWRVATYDAGGNLLTDEYQDLMMEEVYPWFPSHVETTYTYDDLGRPLRTETDWYADGSVDERTTWSYTDVC